MINASQVLYGGADNNTCHIHRNEIRDAAILADRYEINQRFMFASLYGLRPFPADSHVTTERAWDHLAAACMLKLHEPLLEISKMLIKCKESLLSFALTLPDSALGLRLAQTDTPIEAIIPEGNVILVVGAQKLRVQVSSHLLCTTSSVFDAMLNSEFSEGERLRESRGEPIEIELPQDSGRTVVHAFKTLYGADPAMRHLTPKDIQDLAFMADKYDMAPHFALVAPSWMYSLPDDNQACWRLMTAAYWLNLGDFFYKTSAALITSMHRSRLFVYADNTQDKMLGLRLGMAIYERYYAGIYIMRATETKIQVSSGLLKHISPVFKAILDSDMKEGRALRAQTGNEPVYIKLPKDLECFVNAKTGFVEKQANCRHPDWHPGKPINNILGV
ncbi:hypothetical protein F66182_5467 [Fusarium sp. NRRL 66182]|nr:hypothetical protein F66182_5467 [Fusarium sp. NRRL 66182]